MFDTDTREGTFVLALIKAVTTTLLYDDGILPLLAFLICDLHLKFFPKNDSINR